MPDGEAIEAGIVTRSIESAQRKVEARNFDIRKQLLEYDDVANDQRKVIYQQRNDILEAREPRRRRSPALREGVFDRPRAHLRAGRERRGAVGPAGLEKALARRMAARRCRSQQRLESERRDHRRGHASSRCCRPRDEAVRRQGRSRSARAVHASSSASILLQIASTRTGASTWPRSTTCARASTCAAMRRRTRSRNTSARRSSCSAQMLDVGQDRGDARS